MSVRLDKPGRAELDVAQSQSVEVESGVCACCLLHNDAWARWHAAAYIVKDNTQFPVVQTFAVHLLSCARSEDADSRALIACSETTCMLVAIFGSTSTQHGQPTQRNLEQLSCSNPCET